MSELESNILKDIFIRCSELGSRLFRVNVGNAWVGSQVIHVLKRMTYNLERGDIILKAGRPFKTGVPNGYSDATGWTPVTITPEMVGQTLAVYTAIEAKSAKGRTTEAQSLFLTAVDRSGGIAGVARSPDEAERIIAEFKNRF